MPSHGIADGFRNDKTEPGSAHGDRGGSWFGQGVVHMHDDGSTACPRAPLDRPRKLGRGGEFVFLWQHGGQRALSGEACATLLATSRHDGTTGAGAHAGTEAVLAGATTVVRLERTLALGHDGSPKFCSSRSTLGSSRPQPAQTRPESATALDVCASKVFFECRTLRAGGLTRGCCADARRVEIAAVRGFGADHRSQSTFGLREKRPQNVTDQFRLRQAVGCGQIDTPFDSCCFDGGTRNYKYVFFRWSPASLSAGAGKLAAHAKVCLFSPGDSGRLSDSL